MGRSLCVCPCPCVCARVAAVVPRAHGKDDAGVPYLSLIVASMSVCVCVCVCVPQLSQEMMEQMMQEALKGKGEESEGQKKLNVKLQDMEGGQLQQDKE